MSTSIKSGSSGDVAKVTTDNRLDTSSRVNGRIYYQSRDSGKAFSITSFDTTAATEFMLYFKNDSTTEKFHVEIVTLSAVETVLWKLHQVTGTAAGGAVVTPVNLNLSSGVSASATARGTGAITGLTSSSVLDAIRTVATGGAELNLRDALILGEDDAIAIEYDTGTTGLCEAVIIGYYE